MIKTAAAFFCVLACASPAVPANVLIVGDSTVKNYPANDPRMGWGQVMPSLYDPAVARFYNWAVGGRSSKTFILEGIWQNSLNVVVDPDYVLIQFGHNDLLPAPVGTLPGVVPDELPGSGLGSQPIDWYRNNIRTYIADARAAGATPIVITPMERLVFVDGVVKESNLPWAQAAIETAIEEQIQYIDLQSYSVALMNSLGEEGSEILHQYLADGTLDNVHHSPYGATVYATYIAQHISILSGDLNTDGFVGILDLNAVLGNWNQAVQGPVNGDPTGDGYVGIEDLNVVLGNWNAGTPPASSAVPEPGAGAVMFMSGLLLRRRAR